MAKQCDKSGQGTIRGDQWDAVVAAPSVCDCLPGGLWETACKMEGKLVGDIRNVRFTCVTPLSRPVCFLERWEVIQGKTKVEQQLTQGT